MIKISISLLLDAIEDNVDYKVIQSLELEDQLRELTRPFEILPFDRDTKDNIIKQIKQNSQNVFEDDFDTLLQLYF